MPAPVYVDTSAALKLLVEEEESAFVDPMGLAGIDVEATYVGGSAVYERPAG